MFFLLRGLTRLGTVFGKSTYGNDVVLVSYPMFLCALVAQRPSSLTERGLVPQLVIGCVKPDTTVGLGSEVPTTII